MGEYFGWSHKIERIYREDEFGDMRYENGNWYRNISPIGKEWCSEYLGYPYYTTDLHEMNKAESTLTEDEWIDYLFNLRGTTSPTGRVKLSSWPLEFEFRRLICATAAQRCEAFLRTIDKWEDE